MKKITLLLSLLITSIGFSQTELLTNGDFEQGATAWAGNAFNAVDDGSGSNNRNEANVTTAGNAWDVSLNQPVSLTAGTTYVLSYIAYTDATTGTRTMAAGIGQNQAPWAALISNPALTSTPTTFTYTYTVNYASPDVSRVVFDMGAEAGYVFIDDVSLVEFVDTAAPTAFTATAGTISAFSVELLLTATDDSGNVTYDVAYTNSGAQTATMTGVSAQATSLVISGLTPETAYSFTVSASDASGNTATNNPVTVSATTVVDTNTACAGTSSDVQQGTLNGTYDYTFETLTNGDVRMTFELATAVTGLVAYAWRETPFQETSMTVTGKVATIDLTGLTSGNDISYGVKFVWAAGGFAVTKYFTYTVGDDCSTPAVVPTTDAPTPPTLVATDVISIYSDAYTNINVTNFDPDWGQTGAVDAAYDPTGGGTNTVLAYTNFNYQGTDFDFQDASSMENLHVDVWTATAGAVLKVTPINDNTNGGTGVAELLVDVTIVNAGWSSVDIAKSSFTGMVWDRVNQLKFDGASGTNPSDVYIDNIYFWKAPTAGLEDPSLSSIKMHPNPASGIVRFATASSEVLSVSVFDLLGKEVMPAQTIQSELSITGLNPGMYFVKMEQGASSITKKLLVK